MCNVTAILFAYMLAGCLKSSEAARARCKNVTTLTNALSAMDQSESSKLCASCIGGVTTVGAVKRLISHSRTLGKILCSRYTK